MHTGITQLDRLLGYDPNKDEDKIGSIPIGSVILIRGQPGSGKTTLALQIIDRYLKGGRRHAAFISLESHPKRTVDHACKTFAFENLKRQGDTVPKLVELDRNEVSRLFGKEKCDSTTEFANNLIKCIKEKLPEYDPQNDDIGSESNQILIFVDSLLLLADMASQSIRQGDIRGGINSIRDSIKSSLKYACIIFTSEYHQHQSLFYESCYCDIEILLSPEPISGYSSRPVDSFSPIGYNIERIISKSNVTQAIVSRPFCRVLKNRSWPNSSRRCAYDIVDGQGIVFYETYPGDGLLILFKENECQDEVWTEFFEKEVPHRYPSMRFATFDQSGLQRTFASQRGLKHIPERVDLHLTSLDTYWVNWYIEFCQRGDIFDILRKYFPKIPKEWEPHVPNVICLIHDFCLRQTGTHSDIVTITHQAMIEDLAKSHLQLTDDQNTILHACISEIVSHFAKPEAYQGMLSPIKTKYLRLFGEHRSKLIEPFNRVHIHHRSPAQLLEQNSDSDRILSIPYDANVSFMVYRKDLLVIKNTKEAKRLRKELLNIFRQDCGLLGQFVGLSEYKQWLPKQANNEPLVKCFSEEAIQDHIDRLIQRLQDKHPPQTWEEVIALCKIKNLECLIETRTFDTFATTFLELLWNCGGNLEISPLYQLTNPSKTIRHLFQALCLLHRMFDLNITPRGCSVEPAYLKKRFASTTRKDNNSVRDWLFGRFWYSTFVDLLTRKEERTGSRELVWLQDGAQLEIMPIPVSLSHYMEQSANGRSEADIIHTSCWGEWHLAVHKGSENKQLALDLINNVMSSSKICDRAFRNAALPTVEKFYDRYGKASCLNVPDRDITTIPTWTFNQIHDNIFPFANSRNQIFDYRHCMREIHAVLESLHARPTNRKFGVLDFSTDLFRALNAIAACRSQRLMLA